MEEQPTYSVFSKYVLLLVFIIALVIAGVYAWAWLQSEAGARRMGEIGAFWEKYGPIKLMTKQYEETRKAISWETQTNPEAEKQGIMLKSFDSLRSKIKGGEELTLKYDIEVKVPEGASVPTDFYCKIKDTDIQGEIIPPNPTTITSGKKPTVRCKFTELQTETLLGATKIEGGFMFPYTTEDVELPVYFAREETGDFFEKYGIPERNPIQTQYNQEPVGIAIGISDANIQPVIAKDEYNMIGIGIYNKWDGKLKQITSLELVVPQEVTITSEPTTTCPLEFSKQEKGKNIYKAPAGILDDIAIDSPMSFECWADISESIIPMDAEYSKKKYAASIGYLYEVSPKTAVVTVE